MIRICVICQEPFDTKDRGTKSKTCSIKCSFELKRERDKNRHKTEYRKKYMKEYQKTDKEIKRRDDYRKSPKGIDVRRRSWKKHRQKIRAEKESIQMFQILSIGGLSSNTNR